MDAQGSALRLLINGAGGSNPSGGLITNVTPRFPSIFNVPQSTTRDEIVKVAEVVHAPFGKWIGRDCSPSRMDWLSRLLQRTKPVLSKCIGGGVSPREKGRPREDFLDVSVDAAFTCHCVNAGSNCKGYCQTL